MDTIEISRSDEFSMIKIPGIETLSESEQYTVLWRAYLGQQLITNALDAEALRSKLLFIYQEEDDKESRQLEADVRKELESDSCSACYPPELNVPVRNPTNEYRPIIEYWQSLSSTGDVILCAQRADWWKFRAFQQSVRNQYQHSSFSMFVAGVCERRRRHELGSSYVQLLLNPQQQSQQQTWIEFQDYHLIRYEQFAKKRDRLVEKLHKCQKQAGATDLEGSEHTVRSEEAIQGRLEFAERTLRSHRVLLGWIEQQRLRMDSWPLPSVRETDDQSATLRAIPRVSSRQRRSRQFSTSTVQGKIRVSKPTLNTSNMRAKTVKASTPQPVIMDSDVTAPDCTQQRPKRQGMKPLCQEEATRLPRPTLPGDKQTRGRVQAQRQLIQLRSRSEFDAFKTRSGRISRPPVRWSVA